MPGVELIVNLDNYTSTKLADARYYLDLMRNGDNIPDEQRTFKSVFTLTNDWLVYGEYDDPTITEIIIDHFVGVYQRRIANVTDPVSRADAIVKFNEFATYYDATYRVPLMDDIADDMMSVASTIKYNNDEYDDDSDDEDDDEKDVTLEDIIQLLTPVSSQPFSSPQLRRSSDACSVNV